MKLRLKDIIKELFKCKHSNALLYSNEGYCPNCGKYLKKSYYIIRCSHCEIKRSAKKEFGKILPEEKFCINCGESDYYIEKYDKLNFVDINYAIEVKEETDFEQKSFDFEIWVDNNDKKTEQTKEQDQKIYLPRQTKFLTAEH